jgi:2-enoate reductase
MQSDKYKIEPAKVVKNVAVIGGGIGGMEAAIVLAKRGHNVTLYEKSGELGGVFIAAAAPSFKEKDKMLIEWFKREIAKYPNIEVFLHSKVKEIDGLGADEVIVATGAKAIKPRIKGIDRAVTAVDYLLNKEVIGRDVVVIGGGLTGCEIAYDLFLKGKNPTIVEMKNDLIVSDKVPFANASFLRDFFNANDVPVYLETKLVSVDSDGAMVSDKEGKFKIKADTVITALGYKPNPVFKKKKNVHIIGDANEVGNLRTVIWNAWDVCMKI